MTTENKKKDIDYEAYMLSTEPNPERRLNYEEREKRRKAKTKSKITIRLDLDILEAFKELASDDMGYQSLMNKALRDWLEAQSVEELLRSELPSLLEKAIETRFQEERKRVAS